MVVGDAGCGKTCLLARYASASFLGDADSDSAVKELLNDRGDLQETDKTVSRPPSLTAPLE